MLDALFVRRFRSHVACPFKSVNVALFCLHLMHEFVVVEFPPLPRSAPPPLPPSRPPVPPRGASQVVHQHHLQHHHHQQQQMQHAYQMQMQQHQRHLQQTTMSSVHIVTEDWREASSYYAGSSTEYGLLLFQAPRFSFPLDFVCVFLLVYYDCFVLLL